ncbi:MAG: hypothetical protein GY717_19390 [Rhodobacteraceae bacterium]|nr:hypothetical protein [Paracoccaceae bacterium]
MRYLLNVWAVAILAVPTLPGSPARAQGGGDRYEPCLGSETALAYSLPSGDFLELSGQQRNLEFGDWVRACLFDDHVEVSGPYFASLDCDNLRDPGNGGFGYEFTDADGIPVELWFYVDPEIQQPVLEIGVSREGTPDYWIDTGWPICHG